ncbi:MAG: hypothetical protein V3U63_06920 [Gemmatimonadota bacterium]
MKDATLGGYLGEHERPPSFEGRDGGSYTVELMAEPEGGGTAEAGPWRAYLLFVRWRGTEPIGHLESGYLSEGTSEREVREAVERMTLHAVKALLDDLISE